MKALGFLQALDSIIQVQQNSAIRVLAAAFQFIWYLVVAVIVSVIVLMIVRFILNYADLNPFSRPVILVRRLTDPFVNPVRRALAGFGIQPNGAPLVVVLLSILLGYFVLMLTASVLDTVAGISLSVTGVSAGGAVALLGYVLYGALSLYALLIMIRIIFSWGQVSYGNRVMRFLVNVTDPLLLPLRRTVPPIGVFDISPIVAFIIIWLFQAAIRMTLLRGWPVNFFM
ncbi:MAG: YggT family protein [Acidobacteria bacterium]|nr:YggT family protein [Acidobacteriota bacterium]